MDLKERIIKIIKQGDKIKIFYSRHLELKVTGRANQFISLCPFHNDHHPSLSINTENGLFYCFACGFGGDIFTFRMKLEGINFQTCLEAFASDLQITTGEF